MYSPIKLSIKGSDLNESISFNFNFSTPSHFLAKGYVLNNEGAPIKNAGIEVVRENIDTRDREILGVFFTDMYGFYALSLESTSIYDYLFFVYSSI